VDKSIFYTKHNLYYHDNTVGMDFDLDKNV